MAQYVNQIMFSRPISTSEVDVAFTVEMTDFVAGTNDIISFAATRYAYPTPASGTDLTAKGSIVTSNGYSAISMTTIWTGGADTPAAGIYRVKILATDNAGRDQEANIIIPVI